MKVGDLVRIVQPRVGVAIGTLGMIIDQRELVGIPRYVVDIMVDSPRHNPMNYLTEHLEVISECR